VGPPVAGQPGPGTPLSLEDLLARGVAINWDEAVAVVEALCDVLQAQGSESVVPGAGSVLIDASGAVSLKPHARGDRGPTAAGHLLHDLMANSANVPVALRLFVSQSTAAGTHESLKEFAVALAYFGRPDRAQMMRGLYHRGAAPAIAPVTAAPLVPPPLKAQEPERPKPSPAPRKRRRHRWLLGGIAVGAVVLLAFVFSNQSRLKSGGHGAVALWSSVKGAVAGIMQTAGAGGDTTAAADPSKDAKQPVATGAKAARRAAASARKPRAAITSTPAGTVKETPPDAIPAVLESRPLTAVPALVSTSSPVVDSLRGAEPPAVVAAESIQPVDRPVLYSSEDADVEPPVLLGPLPRPIVVVDRKLAKIVNRLEVLVAPDGTVERARFIDGPHRMPDTMLLSGAKTWKFAPASKNGKPVWYRAFVTWSGVP